RETGEGAQVPMKRMVMVVVLLALAGASGAQETPPSDAVQRELQAVQDLRVRASAEFDGPQQSRSIVILDEIVTRLEALRREGTLPPRGRDALAEAYELRGRAYYNIGLQEK